MPSRSPHKVGVFLANEHFERREFGTVKKIGTDTECAVDHLSDAPHLLRRSVRGDMREPPVDRIALLPAQCGARVPSRRHVARSDLRLLVAPVCEELVERPQPDQAGFEERVRG